MGCNIDDELGDLRGGIRQIIEALQVIRAKMDTQATVVSEITNSVVDPAPEAVIVASIPPYGLHPEFLHPTPVNQQVAPLGGEIPQAIPTYAQASVQTQVRPTFHNPLLIFGVHEEFEGENECRYCENRRRLNRRVATVRYLSHGRERKRSE